MAEITKIEVQKKKDNRCNLYLDYEFVCGLESEIIFKYGLKIGKNIDVQELNRLRYESDKITSFNKALKLLNTRFKTKKEVRDYLLEKGYQGDAVDENIDKLIEYGYVNDLHYAEAYINANLKLKSRKIIEDKLRSKGITDAIIDNCFENIDFEFEKDNIRALFLKYMKGKEDNFENNQKAIKFLLMKGYDFDDVKRIVKYKE